MNVKFLPLLILLFAYLSANGQGIRVETLEILGANNTKISFLSNLVEAREGMLLDTLLMERDVQRLKRLPAISHAFYRVNLLNENSCEIQYIIEENFTLIPFANLFSSSNDDFAFRIGLQEFNFLGRNITLGAFYQYDNYSSYGVSVRAPYLLSNKFGLALNYNNFTTLEPVFFQDNTADYKYSNTGVELLGLYELNFENRLELGFSFFTEDYTYISGATNDAVPLALNVDKHLFKFIYDYNGLNYFYHYLDGFRSQLNLQYVGSTDENLPEFLIGFNDFTYFKRIGDRGNWANRLRLGLASNVDS
ncbi:MAG: outer membrane protein assembly factor, partial [Maribacter stanieri]